MRQKLSRLARRVFKSGSKRRARRRKPFLLLLVAAALTSPLISSSSTSLRPPRAPAPAAARPPLSQYVSGRRSDMKKCSACPEVTQQTIYAPTIGLAESAGSQIVLNNRSPNVMEVTPTFYTEGGEAIVGDAVSLQPTEIRFVEVKRLIPARHRRQTAWGGMSLSYTGKVLEVWAQLALLGVGGGGSTDVTFAVLDGRGSDVQEAVWWMPEGGSAVLALGNSSATPLRTTALFANGETQEVDIAPFATRYLRRAAGEGGARSSTGGAPDAVRLTTVGPPGSLRAVGAVTSARWCSPPPGGRTSTP
jgi:hypothetical protein